MPNLFQFSDNYYYFLCIILLPYDFHFLNLAILNQTDKYIRELEVGNKGPAIFLSHLGVPVGSPNTET